MKTIFTKIIYAILALFFLVGISVPAFAQAPLSTVTADAGVSAIAKDNSGNTYVIENPGSFDAGGTPTTGGRIVRYTNGSGTSKVVYNGAFIANNDFANTDNYAFGIAVDASKNIYFTTSIGQSFAYGAIIKLTYNSGTDSYSDGGAPYIDYTSQGGNIGYPTGLAMDASNNLYVLLYNVSDDPSSGGFGAYTVSKYAAGSTTNRTEIYQGLELTGTYNASDTYSSICALAVDPSGNVYVADWFDTRIPANYGGFIEKLTYNSGNGTYAASQLLNNAYCQALGCDASGNLYANIATAANENSGSLVKFTGGAGTPTTIYTGLNGEQDYWNFGMAVIGADIYTSEGNEGTQSQGYYIHIVASPTSASNVSFSSTTAAGTTISWTSGTGTNRAVFVAAASSGSPTVANNTSYTASTTFGSGTLAGAGWYCVYNGTGTSVPITGLSPGTTYRAMVVEYNSSGGLLSYNTGTGATNNPNNVTTATPTISAPGGTTTLTSTVSGTPGSSTSFNISASNLIANVTATAPSNVQVSSDNSTWGSTANITQSGGSISNVPVYVRLAGTGSVGTISGNVALSSTSATTVNQAVSGSLNSPSTSISSLTAVTGTTTNAANIQYTATFAASITGLSTADFTLNTSGVSGASVSSISGSGTSYTITVNTGSGDGTIQLVMNSSSGVSSSISNLPFSGSTYTVDKTAPTVSSITASSPSNATPTNATSLTYNVTFSKSVTGVDASDFTVTASGSSGVVSNVSGSGANYTVTVGSVSGTGPLRLDLNGSGTGITDAAGNVISGGFTSGDVYNIDNTPATLIAGSYFSNNGNSSQYAKVGDQLTLSVGYNEPLQSAAMTIGGNTISVSFSNGNQNFSGVYTMTSGDTEGNVGWTLSATDLAGNVRNYSNNDFGTVLIFDKTPPLANISAPSAATVTNDGTASVSYTVTYSDANFNYSSLSNADITLNSTGTATGTTAISGSGNSYTVTVSNITGLGTLGISIGASTAQDIPGNIAVAAGPSATFNVFNNNPGLASLGVSKGALSPAFATGTTSYTTTVGNGITTLTVTPTTSDANATVTVNGTAVTSGTASAPVNLNVGSNVITIVVTAQDGGTKQTYTETVTRGASINAQLGYLASNRGPLTPGFVNTTTSYTQSVPNYITSIVFTPTTGDPTATVAVNGTPVTSHTNSAPQPLAVGDNVESIVVTAGDGVTKKTYTVTVTRAKSSDAYLANLVQTFGSPSPVFTSRTFSYTSTVGNGITAISVTPTTSDAGATVKVNGASVNSGSRSTPIALNVGGNTISVVVTAQDGVSKQTYTLTVTRGPSQNAKLGYLATNQGALTPGFVNTTTSYTKSVANSVTSIVFLPTVGDPSATVTVNGTAVTSHTNSAPQPLAVGDNVENITVTAGDGVTQLTYTVTVTRAMSSANSVYNPISVVAPTENAQFIADNINVHQGLSPNGDGINDFLLIDGITKYPDNKLQIMNKSGQLVYEAKGYDNSTKVFDGHSNKNGTMQLPGTYFYSLDVTANGVTQHKTGFIVLKY